MRAKWVLIGVLTGLTAWNALATGAETKWTALFNGKDLTGWTKMHQGDWTVQKGVMKYTGGGNGWLRTNAQFRDFELETEWRFLKAPYDSGLFFGAGLEGKPWPRVAYQVQMLRGGEGSVGGVGGAKARPDLIKPAGEWNRFRLTVRGKTVQLSINGKEAWRAENVANRKGYLGWQAEGAPLEVRVFRIRPLGEGGAAKSAPPGFVRLFNGKDLTGWKAIGREDAWQVQDGLLTCVAGRSGGWLRTDKTYKDFVVRYEYKTAPKANNGFFFRAALEGNPAFSGYEIQVIDDHGKPADIHGSGSVYGAIKPSSNPVKPAGEWNKAQIRLQGMKIVIHLNGQKIVDADMSDPEISDKAQARKLTERVKEGYFGLQNYGNFVQYRNLAVEEL